MNTLKLFAVLTFAVGSIALVLGTGAFTAVEADRFGDVGIADDDSALLGIEIVGGEVEPNEEATIVTLENSFGEDIESVDVTVIDEGPFNNVNIQETPDHLAPGADGDIEATVAGQPGTSGEIELTITATSSSGASVELTREVFIEIEDVGIDVCTIENTDEIGDRLFEAEDKTFDCTVRIEDTDQYEVDLENTTVTGDFELSTDLLEEFELDESNIDGETDIDVSQNIIDDIDIESTTFGDDVSINVDQNLNDDIEFDENDIDGTLDISVGNLNSDIELDESNVGDDLLITVDGNANDDIEIEDTDIGGDIEIVIDGNLNSDIEIEDGDVGEIDIIIKGNKNGEIEIEDVSYDDKTIETGSPGGGGPPG